MNTHISFNKVIDNFRIKDYGGQFKNIFEAWGLDENDEKKELWSLIYRNSTKVPTMTLTTQYDNKELKIRLTEPTFDPLSLESTYVYATLNGKNILGIDSVEQVQLLDIVFSLIEKYDFFDALDRAKNYTIESPLEVAKPKKSKKIGELEKKLSKELEKVTPVIEEKEESELFSKASYTISLKDKKTMKMLYKEGLIPKDVRTIETAYEYLK
ncbi:MAG: hypothetical protein VXZ40_00820 [Nanoarchaeota archaeon]|nr:hypothetical protein [Nanoarchaeota archaeon]